MKLRFRCAFVSFLNKSEIPIPFYYDLGASTALLLRFYCALAVSATIHVILIKISNRSGIAVQWNGGVLEITVFVVAVVVVTYIIDAVKPIDM